MSINPEYLKLFVKATEMAAYGASKFIGKNDLSSNNNIYLFKL